MLKLLATFWLIILLSVSPEPENLTLDDREEAKPEPEGLTLDGEPQVEDLSLDGSVMVFSLTTTPPGAMVYLDGERFGITPIEGKLIEGGQHFVALRKRGFYPYEKDMIIDGDGEFSLNLPIVEAPEGYDEATRDVEISAGIILDMEMNAFRLWLTSDPRYAEDLVIIAQKCAKLGSMMQDAGLKYDALRCRNLAAGFYQLVELAAGTSYFAEDPGESLKIAKGCAKAMLLNDEELNRLVDRFILELHAFDGYTRGVAAHSLRHAYSSLSGVKNVVYVLENLLPSEPVEFIRQIIMESLEQIEFDPE